MCEKCRARGSVLRAIALAAISLLAPPAAQLVSRIAKVRAKLGERIGSLVDVGDDPQGAALEQIRSDYERFTEEYKRELQQTVGGITTVDLEAANTALREAAEGMEEVRGVLGGVIRERFEAGDRTMSPEAQEVIRQHLSMRRAERELFSVMDVFAGLGRQGGPISPHVQ